MSEEFERGLRDLHDAAARAHAGGDGFPAAAMAGRARRNRRVRTGALSAVATVAVVGVVWAGTAVAGLGDPAPLQPAQPTAEPTATATPDTYAGPACGTAIGDVALFDEPPLVIEVTLGEDAVEPGEALGGRVVLAVAGALDITLQPDGMLEGLDYTAVQDGVVVGYGRSALVDGTWQTLSGRQGVTALATLQLRPCDEGADALAAGDYQLFTSMPVMGAGEGEQPVTRTVLGGPWPFTVREDPWRPIELADVPVDVPGAEQRLIRADAHTDGRQWRVTVEFDSCWDMYERALGALVDGGYEVVSEESDPRRPFWSRGVLRGDGFDVDLETSNETGGGCYGDYHIVAR